MEQFKKLAVMVGLPDEDSIDKIAERAIFTLTNGIDERKEFSEMVSKLLKKGDDIHATVTPTKMNLIHLAMGISGEAAELLEGVRNRDLPNIIEESGDLEFYIEGLIQEIDPDYKFNTYHIADAEISTFDLVNCAGGITDIIKKHAVYNKVLDIDGLRNHLDELSLFLSRTYTALNISRLDILRYNMGKLLINSNARYKSGEYSDEQAQSRNDKL